MKTNKRFKLDVSLAQQTVFIPRSSIYREVKMTAGIMWLHVEVKREDTAVERTIFIYPTNENIREDLIYIGNAQSPLGIMWHFYGEV